MLGHRLRRWPVIKTSLVQRLLFAGVSARSLNIPLFPARSSPCLFSRTIRLLVFPCSVLFSRLPILTACRLHNKTALAGHITFSLYHPLSAMSLVSAQKL